MIYSRDVPDTAPPGAIDRTEEHVRAHISAALTYNDNAGAFAAVVQVNRERVEGGTRIVGALSGTPAAEYLTPGYDPYEGVSERLRLVARQ